MSASLRDMKVQIIAPARSTEQYQQRQQQLQLSASRMAQTIAFNTHSYKQCWFGHVWIFGNAVYIINYNPYAVMA
jgi:hypothetical protein